MEKRIDYLDTAISDSGIIKALRFPLAVLVVFVHLNPDVRVDGNWAEVIMGSISRILAHIAIPTFFFISGYLFFKNLEKWSTNVWRDKIKRRIRSLLVPYLGWNIIYILFSIVPIFIACIVKDRPFSKICQWYSANGGLSMLWCSHVWNEQAMDLFGNSALLTGPFVLQFWFLRDLLVMIALSPLIYVVFTPLSSKLLSFAKNGTGLIVLLFFYLTGFAFGIPGLNSQSLFFFSVGALFSLNKISIIRIANPYRYVWYSLFILSYLFVLLNYDRGGAKFAIHNCQVFVFHNRSGLYLRSCCKLFPGIL